MSASKGKRGRPSVYTPAIADEICERVGGGRKRRCDLPRPADAARKHDPRMGAR